MANKYIRPFLKWAGNKYKVLPRIIAALPPGKRLIEPFMGSGSLMLNRPIESYLGGDINADLIDVFKLLQENGKYFLEEVKPLFTQEWFDQSPTEKHTKPGEVAFYAARAEFNETTDKVRKAALFIFLNQHCFNGLCRYNRYGEFTTPYNLGFTAKKKPADLAEDRFWHAIKMCAGAEFQAASFEEVMMQAQPGDVIYCDPPYLPQDGKVGTLARELQLRGVTTVISNHNSEKAQKLYAGAEIQTFTVARSMGRYEGHENTASELLAIFKAKM